MIHHHTWPFQQVVLDGPLQVVLFMSDLCMTQKPRPWAALTMITRFKAGQSVETQRSAWTRAELVMTSRSAIAPQLKLTWTECDWSECDMVHITLPFSGHRLVDNVCYPHRSLRGCLSILSATDVGLFFCSKVVSSFAVALWTEGCTGTAGDQVHERQH